MDLVKITRARVSTKVGESKAKVSQMPLLVPRDLVKITDGESNEGDPGVSAPSRLAMPVARVKNDPPVLEIKHVAHGAFVASVRARGGAGW